MGNYKKALVISVLLFCLIVSTAFAGNLTFIKEYTYQASEIDSKVSSRAIALEQVKRLLLEELGTYLISETEVKDFQLTKDQITVLTAGIVSSEVIEEKWDGVTYYLKAKIQADPDEVVKSVNALRQDKQKSKELEESRKKAGEALREIERLKKEISALKATTKQQEEYATAVNELSAADWFDKGYAFSISDRHTKAIAHYNMAIEINPKYAEAYSNRGGAYYKLGNYQQAIKDYNRAIELNPEYANAYNNRGLAHDELGNYQQAIEDFNRAIELNPKLAEAYYNRGNAYYDLGNYQQAIRDYDRAIELDPKLALAYYNRGTAYYNLGNHQQAIEDYKIAARLGYKPAQEFLRSKGIDW